MQFDLLIRAARSSTRAAGTRAGSTSRITGDRIAAVDLDIPEESAFRVIDADGADRHARASSTCTRTSSTR